MPKNTRGVKAQLCSASGQSSKVLKDAESLEVVVEMPGRGTLVLRVQSGGGYSLRAHPEADAGGGDGAAERDLVAVGVVGAEEVVSVVPG